MVIWKCIIIYIFIIIIYIYYIILYYIILYIYYIIYAYYIDILYICIYVCIRIGRKTWQPRSMGYSMFGPTQMPKWVRRTVCNGRKKTYGRYHQPEVATVGTCNGHFGILLGFFMKNLSHSYQFFFSWASSAVPFRSGYAPIAILTHQEPRAKCLGLPLPLLQGGSLIVPEKGSRLFGSKAFVSNRDTLW